MGQTRITVTIDEDQYAAISEIGEVEGRGLSEIVREGLAAVIADRWHPTIEATAAEAIKDKKMTNEEALAFVRRLHPHSATSLASIAWYRTKLRKTHPSIKSDSQIKHERKQAQDKPARKQRDKA